jgi:hypothetical protein
MNGSFLRRRGFAFRISERSVKSPGRRITPILETAATRSALRRQVGNSHRESPPIKRYEFGIRIFAGKQSDGVNRVVRTGAVYFKAGKFKGGVVRDHTLKHGETMFERGNGIFLFVGRVGREHPEQAVKLKLGNASPARMRCPICGGSNVPPNKPILFFDMREVYRKVFFRTRDFLVVYFFTGIKMSDVTIMSSTSPLKRIIHAIRAIGSR